MFDFPEGLSRFVKGLIGDDGPEIRLMTQRDLDEVLRLIRLHDSDDYKAAKQSFAHTSFDAPMEQSAHFVLIDPEEHRPVAVCGYYVDDLEAQGVYWLGWTYVNPFFRGRGYGGALMEVSLSHLQNMGARKCYLTTSALPKYEQAVGFYKRYNFIIEGRLLDFYAPGEDQIIMGVDLARLPAFKKRHWSRPTTSPRTRTPEWDKPTSKKEPPRKKDGDDDKVVFEF